MKVLKFGGSSLSTVENILKVKQIIESQKGYNVIIISAYGNTTDQLLTMGKKAAMNDEDYLMDFHRLQSFYTDILNELFTGKKKSEIEIKIHNHFIALEDLLCGTYTIKELSLQTQDSVLSYGEIMSSIIMTELLSNAGFFNSTEIIKTDGTFGKAKVNFEKTNSIIRDKLASIKTNAIVPGFIASNSVGEITTLGRGGSDYTAAIIAAALEAECLEMWTDVDGFMTADPKIVEKALAIPQLSYAEAMELSHFGAEVVYTPTIQPVYQKSIEVHIKNTFNPDAPGTVICRESGKSDALIKGVSSINDIQLITIQGPGLVGVKGLSGRLFTALGENNVNVILIAQASSEYSISFAINPEDGQKAKKAIQKEFEKEIRSKVMKINVEENLSIIAIVGEKMRHTPGISANLFQSLGRNGINIIATAQGSCEINISVVIHRDSLKKAMNVIHEGFFISYVKVLHLFIVGTGTVGGALLKQINRQQKNLLENQQIRINVVGIADIDHMYIDPEGINLNNYREILKNKGEEVDLTVFTDTIIELNLRNNVFVDCTAAKPVADLYHKLLNSFVSVVAANKIACSSEMKLYRKLKETAVKRGVKFMYETNVGAGLPIINTIQNLINSGDKIVGLEAVLSGTLNFVFNEISEKILLSRAIMLAREHGFSEPDPRIDLSGIDVIRKILILAREAGYELEQKDVESKPFLPEECFKGDLDDFWDSVKKYDHDFEERRKKLAEENKKWRFVARLENGKTSVELKEVDSSHPSYPLEGSNNIILITTERYKDHPMIIRGYGAGADVTAAGVFGDIMQISHV